MRPTTLISLSLTAAAAAQAADPTIVIPYQVPADSRVSLAVYNGQGQLVRTLLTGAARKPGQYVVTWDGRDRYGNALPSGTYTWKQASSPGLWAEYITQLGVNHSPSYARGVGNHNPPQVVAVDATGVYRVGGLDEGTSRAQKTDFDGNLIWANERWSDGWNDYGKALALGGGDLFDLGGNGVLWGYRADTGRCFTNDNFDPKPWNIRWPGDADAEGYADSVGMDLAYDPAANLVVASYRTKNGIRWLNRTNGSQVASITTVTAPVSIAAAADGTIFAISQGAVVRVTRTATTPVTVIPASALQSPWRIAIDPSDGSIWVAENSDRAGGARHHQVKHFSAAGALIRSYGRAEGRQDGAYVATDFRGITDITADGLGGFLVSERWYAPRRTVRIAADGSLVREWIGAQHYGVLGFPEPGDPTHAWYKVNAPDGQIGLVRCRIDLVSRTWTILETYTDSIAASLAGQLADDQIDIFTRNGRTYLRSGNCFGLWLAVYDQEQRTLRVCNASGPAYKDNRWHIPAAIRPTDGSQPYSYRWNDENDDGVATMDEIEWGVGIGGYLDPQTLELITTPEATGFNAGPRYLPSQVTSGGTPIYGASTANWPKWTEQAGEQYNSYDFRRSTNGGMYGVISDVFMPAGESNWELHGRWYFNRETGINRVIKWAADGTQLWSVGRHSADPDHAPGSMVLPRSLVGTVGDYVVVADASDEEYIGAHVYTGDGLWVGEIPSQPANLSNEVIHGILGNERPNYRIARDDQSGAVLFFGQTAAGGAPVFRIHGWDGIAASTGTVTLSAPAALGATGTGLTAEFFTNATWTGSPVTTRTDAEIWYEDSRMPLPAQAASGDISIRWTGQVLAQHSGEASFSFDGERAYRSGTRHSTARVWVDGRLLLDGSGLQENGRIMLTAGRRYDIRVEAAFAGVGANGLQFRLHWETGDLDRRRVRQRFLFPTGTSGQLHPGGLQAQWRCDEGSGTTVADASGGGRTLALSGSGWTANGRIGAGLQLSGSGSGSASLDASETSRTVALWFRTTADGGLFATADAGSGSDGDLWVAGGRVHARVGNQTISSAGGGLADGAWHHLVHVLGGPEGGQRLYVDGRLVAAGDRSASTFTGQTRVLVGRAPAAPTPGFTGSIDEVRVYDRALSARAIEDEVYRREVGLIAHFAFDEGAGVIARDLAGTPQVFATLAGNASWTNGKFGKALRIQPRPFMPTVAYSNTEVRVPMTDLTFAFWYRTGSQWTQLAAVDRDSSYNYIIQPIEIAMDSGNLRTRILDDGGDAHFISSSNVVTYNNQWHHVAVTLSSQGGAALYLDGQPVGTLPNVRNIAYSNRFGVDFGGGDADVDIDDGRIYGRALSASEIAALYASTPVNPVTPPATPAAPTVAGNGTVGPTLSGTGVVGQQIRVLLDGQEVGMTQVRNDGTWSYALSGIANGSYQVTVTAGNAGGTSAPSPAVTVTVGSATDTTPPATPAAPTTSSTTSATPTLSGTTEAGATVKVYNNGALVGTVTANGSGAWTWTPSTALAAGSHAFTVTATDAAGNVSGTSAARTVTVAATDTTPPATPAAPTTSSTTSATPTLSGTTEAGATVKVYDNGALVGTVTANGSGAWTWTPSTALAAGSHAFTVTATDAAGNVSGASTAVTVTVAATPGGGGGAVKIGSSGSGGGCGLGGASGLLVGLMALRLMRRRRPQASACR